MGTRDVFRRCLCLGAAWVLVAAAVSGGRIFGAARGLLDAGTAVEQVATDHKDAMAELASLAAWILTPPAILLALAGLLQPGQAEPRLPQKRHWGSPGRGLKLPIRRP